jgi:hypothetical protein
VSIGFRHFRRERAVVYIQGALKGLADKMKDGSSGDSPPTSPKQTPSSPQPMSPSPFSPGGNGKMATPPNTPFPPVSPTASSGGSDHSRVGSPLPGGASYLHGPPLPAKQGHSDGVVLTGGLPLPRHKKSAPRDGIASTTAASDIEGSSDDEGGEIRRTMIRLGPVAVASDEGVPSATTANAPRGAADNANVEGGNSNTSNNSGSSGSSTGGSIVRGSRKSSLAHVRRSSFVTVLTSGSFDSGWDVGLESGEDQGWSDTNKPRERDHPVSTPADLSSPTARASALLAAKAFAPDSSSSSSSSSSTSSIIVTPITVTATSTALSLSSVSSETTSTHRDSLSVPLAITSAVAALANAPMTPSQSLTTTSSLSPSPSPLSAPLIVSKAFPSSPQGLSVPLTPATSTSATPGAAVAISSSSVDAISLDGTPLAHISQSQLNQLLSLLSLHEHRSAADSHPASWWPLITQPSSSSSSSSSLAPVSLSLSNSLSSSSSTGGGGRDSVIVPPLASSSSSPPTPSITNTIGTTSFEESKTTSPPPATTVVAADTAAPTVTSTSPATEVEEVVTEAIAVSPAGVVTFAPSSPSSSNCSHSGDEVVVSVSPSPTSSSITTEHITTDVVTTSVVVNVTIAPMSSPSSSTTSTST